MARHGENVTAYCNISSLYHARGDDEKAEYYYRRALTVRKGEKAEDYKIAACAIERGDDELVKRCVLTILEERPYDDVMNFFYGVSLINTGDFAGGATAINVSLKISPEDPVYEYYSDFARKLTDAKAEERKALPLKYVKALPSDAESRYKKTVNAFVNGKKSYESLSDDGVKKILKAELFSEDIKIAKSAAFLLGVSGTEKDRKILELALLDGDVDDEIKSSVVYLLVNSGDKRKINAVISNYFATVRPRKVVFENKKDGALFMSAYALAVAKSMFWGVEDTAKIAFNMNALYTHFKELIRFNGFGVDAIAACCYLMCEFPRLNDVNNVCVAFGVSRADESQVEEFYEFVKKSLPEKMRERAESARNTRIKENEGDKDNQS